MHEKSNLTFAMRCPLFSRQSLFKKLLRENSLGVGLNNWNRLRLVRYIEIRYLPLKHLPISLFWLAELERNAFLISCEFVFYEILWMLHFNKQKVFFN